MPSSRVYLMMAVLVSGMVAIPSAPSAAAVPSLVNYQGILTDGSGTPQVGGPFSITFSIYDDASATNPALWSELQSVATDAQGRFNVLLGTVTPLADAVFSGADRWLGTRVSPDPSDLLPRTRVASVAYAFRPATVDGATGGNITTKVSIGPGHTNTGTNAFVAGESNTASGAYSAVAGGIGNRATLTGAAVGGGASNEATAFYATIGGGSGNDATSDMSTIGGGVGNEASGLESTVGGGRANRSIGTNATIGGGYLNFAFGYTAAVAGGRSNSTSADYAAIGGGESNTAFGLYSVVPGGVLNKADAYASFAAGRQAQALTNGTFVWADSGTGPFISTARNQFLMRASGGVGIGTNSPSEQLHVVGNILATGCVIGSNIACPSDSRFKKNIVAMTDALDAIERLRGVNYEWNRDRFPGQGFGEGQQVGLIAQEVRKVVPQAVIEQSDGYLAVDYARLVPLLIEGMKEQQRTIQGQRERIEKLERKFEQIVP